MLIPDIGDGSKVCRLVRWRVAIGSPVREEDPVAEIEYDQASVEIPSPTRGRVTELHVAANEARGIRAPLLSLREDGAGLSE